MGFFSSVWKEIKRDVKRKPMVIKAFEDLTGTTARKEQEKAQKAALAQSKAANLQARKAEVFGQTEGKGSGTLGQIRSGLGDEIEDEDLRQGKGRKSSLRI